MPPYVFAASWDGKPITMVIGWPRAVWPRAMMWSLGLPACSRTSVAAELAAEAAEREAAERGPSLVKVPSQTCSARGFSTAKVTDRSRPIRAP
jgi:hypothetical protein